MTLPIELQTRRQLERASAWARPGDLLVHFVHIEREAVIAWLDRKAR